MALGGSIPDNATCSDSAGNVYSQDDGVSDSAAFTTICSTHSLATQLGAGSLIVVAWTGGVGPQSVSMHAFYVTGLTGALDQTASNFGDNSSPTAALGGATSQANELLFAVILDEGATVNTATFAAGGNGTGDNCMTSGTPSYSPYSPAGSSVDSDPPALFAMQCIVSASGPYQANATIGSGNWQALLAAYEAVDLLSVTLAGTGSGTVTSTPPGINCGATCSANFDPGSQVTLTASASSGSFFAGWSGGGCTGTSTCVTTVNGAETVTATFTEITYTLSVTESGTGAGHVTSSPSGINCSPTSNQCSSSFNSGSMVTLTASASSGSSFAGWSGGGCGGTEPCQVTLSANTKVTATFTLIPTSTLSIAETGGGSGTVTSAPSGINCGATCSASFATGTPITLTAAIGANSTFAGWSGGGCSGTGTCALTLNANTTITASFVADSAAQVNLLAAVLPDSRSVEVGATATVFATMLNTGTVDGTTCGIAPATSVAAAFAYQTTNPATNATTGTANTPATVPAGSGQTFVLALTPTAAFNPTDIAFTYTCANAANPAQSVLGLNTLNLSASTTPVPDIIAVNATSDPGYVDISPTTSTGAFAVATFNMGAAATITASANTGTANLPVTLTICQTSPSTGACLAAPASSVTLAINSGDADTFGVFVLGSSAIPDMPAVNRIFVTFTDSGGTLRGETSVAVRTQ